MFIYLSFKGEGEILVVKELRPFTLPLSRALSNGKPRDWGLCLQNDSRVGGWEERDC